MTKNSPFAVWLRVSGYAALLSLGVVCYLFATANSPTQYLLTVVIAILLLMLSVCVGFYCGMQRYHDKQHARFMAAKSGSDHYPQRSAFEQKRLEALRDQKVRITRIDTFA